MLDCHPEVFRRIPRRSAEGRDLRVQYFLTYCVIGSVLPFVSVYFRRSGLTNAQVAYAWTLWSAAVVLSPFVVTLAADAHSDPPRLLVPGSALLADPLPKNLAQADAEAVADRRLPTVSAARALLRPHLIVFTAAVVLVQMAGSAYSTFYPIHLTERVGLRAMWIGPATILAVS